MIATIYTPRLILRPFSVSDDIAMFRLDSDPLVHTYLGNKTVNDIAESREIIASVMRQYVDLGIGRWAATLRSSGEVIGWSGLKLMPESAENPAGYYDVGYRFMPQYWGNGFATESAQAALCHGFRTMGLTEIVGTAHNENIASRKVLEKCGLRYVKKYKWNDITCDWLCITREEWEAQQDAAISA